MTKFIFRGYGRYAPERIVTNDDLAKFVDTNDEWITSRTGIKQRHMVAKGESASDMALEAAKMALKGAGMKAENLTHIVFGTFTPDAMIPTAACRLQNKLGIKGQMCLDVSAACSGFLYALETARGYIALNPKSNVLVVCSEVITPRLNWKDRASCVLFGDAAGAVIVTGNEDIGGPEVTDVLLKAEGSLGDLLMVNGGGSADPYSMGSTVGPEYFVQLEGREIYKHAVRKMSDVCEEILEKNGIDINDIDILLPHQANMRIIEAVGRKINIPDEKVFANIDKYANTSAASIPVALSEAVETGFIKPGNLVLMTSFGGGFTWGAALVQF